MNRIYSDVGKEFNNTKEKQEKIALAINSLKWFDLPVITLPFSQGYALIEMIKQAGNNTDKIGYGIYDDKLAFLAMRNNYSEGNVRRATLYTIDTGTELINIAIDEETAEDIPDEPYPAGL